MSNQILQEKPSLPSKFKAGMWNYLKGSFLKGALPTAGVLALLGLLLGGPLGTEILAPASSVHLELLENLLVRDILSTLPPVNSELEGAKLGILLGAVGGPSIVISLSLLWNFYKRLPKALRWAIGFAPFTSILGIIFGAYIGHEMTQNWVGIATGVDWGLPIGAALPFFCAGLICLARFIDKREH